MIEVRLTPEQLDELADRVAEKLASRRPAEPAAMLRPREVAAMLAVSERQVRALCTSGTLAGVQVGSSWRIPRSAVEALMVARDAAA